MRKLLLLLVLAIFMFSCGNVIIGDRSKTTYTYPDLYLYNNPTIAVLPMISDNPDYQKYLAIGDTLLPFAFNKLRSGVTTYDANYILKRLVTLGWFKDMNEFRAKVFEMVVSKDDRSNATFFNDLCDAIGAQYALRPVLNEYFVEEKVVLGSPSRHLVAKIDAVLWDSKYRDISAHGASDTASLGNFGDFDPDELRATEASGLVSWQGFGKGEATGPIEKPPPTSAELIGKTCEGLVKTLP